MIREDRKTRQWPWFVGFGACGTALFLGLWSLTQPNVVWTHRLFWLVLGAGGLGFLTSYRWQPPVLTPEALERIGMGQIVARIPQHEGSLQCSQCGTSSISQPLWQRDKVFCSASCQQATQTRLESPRYFLPPPLPATTMIDLLEQASQLAERALHAASQQAIDQPLLLASHRGQGAVVKIERVALSLDVWGWSSWAEQLRQTPPPEPLPTGGYQGDPQFFESAKTLKQILQEHPLPHNPFELLQLQHALDRKELETLQQQPLTPQQQEALTRLERLLQTGEQRLEQLLRSASAKNR